MYIRLTFIIISFLCFSCSSYLLDNNNLETNQLETGTLETINIDVESLIEVSPSSFFDESASFILLENNQMPRKARIIKFLKVDDKIYLLDMRNNSVLSYDNEGRFLKPIGIKGLGQGEIAMIYDMIYNEVTNELELLSPVGKVVSYDLENESYKDLAAIPVTSAHHFIHLNELIIAHSNYDAKEFYAYSQKSKGLTDLSKTNLEFTRKFSVSASHSPFYIYKNSIKYFDPYLMNVSRIDSSLVTLETNFDFGEFNFNPDEFNSEGRNFMEEIDQENVVFPSFGFIETEKFYFMSVKQRDEIHNLIIRKDNKQVYNLNLNNLGMPIVQFDGTYFYAMIGNQKDAEQVNSMLGNDPDQYDFSEGKSSNLVIFKFKINDNFLSTN